MHASYRQGFTLIELSIVLVIIGLLVGGILVGRDLIKAAELRATLRQKETFTSAVNTFRLKYGGLPGDLYYSKAAQFGFFAYSHASAGTSEFQDGNGLVWSGGILAGNQRMAYETLIFWQHLSQARLISGSYGVGSDPTTTGGCLSTVISGNDVSRFLPAAKLGRNVSWGMEATDLSQNGFPGPHGMVNAYWLAAVSGIDTVANECRRSIPTPALTPMEAYTLDSKIDDGIPMTGKVWGFVYAGGWAELSTPGNCVYAGFFWQHDWNRYNIPTSASANTPACNMYFMW